MTDIGLFSAFTPTMVFLTLLGYLAIARKVPVGGWETTTTSMMVIAIFITAGTFVPIATGFYTLGVVM